MCRLKMMLVALLVTLPVAAGAQAPQWVVRDLEGGLVGPVLSQGSPGTNALSDDSPLAVARRIPGKWLVLRVSQNAVWATRRLVPFLFESFDCSGPAFLDAPRKKNEALATVVFDTNVYWPAGNGESRPIRSKAILVSNPGECQDALVGSDLCCSTLADEEEHFAAEIGSAALAKLNLRPPFRLERVVTSVK